MKLVMTLLARDEADIIEENLWFHLEQGVDFIIAMNNRSLDGTREILERYARLGCVHILDEEGEDFLQRRWVTRMARMACIEYQADWVINCDADEFWWPVSGTLKDALRTIPETFGVYKARSWNFAPRPDGPAWVLDRMTFRDNWSLNPFGRRYAGKMCHRAVPDIEVKQGNHRVLSPLLGPKYKGHLIEILHFPLRYYAQMERKVRYIVEGLDRDPGAGPNSGRVKRFFYDLYLKGQLRDYYESQVLHDNEIDDAIAQGRISIDRRLQQFFHQRQYPSAGRSLTPLIDDHPEADRIVQ